MTKREEYKIKRRMANAYANIAAVGAITTIAAVSIEAKPVVKLAIAGSGMLLASAGVIATCREIDKAVEIYSEMDRCDQALADIEETLDRYCS